MGDSDLSTDSECDNRSNTNSPVHHALDQVDSNTDLLDKVILTEVVLQPTKKPRSVGQHKSISKKNDNNKKLRLGNKKFRSVSKSPYGITADLNSNNGLKPSRHLLYKSEEKDKYPLMITSISIPIVGWKITKKQSHIISDISILSHLQHCGFNHRFELNTDSPSKSDKDKRLLYNLIERLLFIREITVPDVHACVSYTITRMESPSIYLSQKRPLASRCTISEKIMTVLIVIYRKTLCTFGIIVFETY